MTEQQFFDNWKAVREQLQELVKDLDREQISLEDLKDGLLKLAKLDMMVVKALEVLSVDYSYTIKLLKEKDAEN